MVVGTSICTITYCIFMFEENKRETSGGFFMNWKKGTRG